jgi:glycine cleavage system aminomethyltransferase T
MLFREDTVARAEAMAVRTAAGWYRWQHDLVQISGPDAAKYLDYICVNDIAGAAPGVSKYTTILNDDGKIVDDVIVTNLGDEIFWVSTLYAPRFAKWFDKKGNDYDCTLKELTYEVDMYAVQGPDSLQEMNKLLEKPIDEMKRFRMADNRMAGVDVKIHRSGFTGENGYEIYCPIEETAKIKERLKASGIKELRTLEVYLRSLPMEKGFALRQDMYGLTPYECGLGWSVKMDKEFNGKEALTNYESQYKLVGFTFTPERDGYEDVAQNEIVKHKGIQCGICRQMIYGYTVNKNIGFAIVEKKFAENGTVLTVGPNDAVITGCNKVFIK